MLAVVDQNNLRIQHLKARCLMQQGEFEEAASILTNCKLINPFNVERLVDLGRAFIQTNQIREALATFDEALELDKDNKPAALGRAQCRLLEGDVNDALGLLRQISTQREVASLFNNAAILAIRQNRFDHGFSLYRAAIGAVGNSPRIVARLLYNLGIAQYKHFKLDEALECFESSFKQDPAFIKAKQNAQVIAHKLGRKALVSTSTQKPAKMDENFAEVFEDEQFKGS
jgi:tetratricopeptide (TPR) repeat protein